MQEPEPDVAGRPPQGGPPVISATTMNPSTVELRISKRLLWVGGAAYPLHNIARVYTFTLRPKRLQAFTAFLRRAGLTVLVLLFLLVLVDGLLPSEDADNILPAVWAAGVMLLVFHTGALFVVLVSPDHHVLAVETSGPSTAVVTARNAEHLDRLVGYIAHAIDNPEAEFHVQVETLSINAGNYHFGDNVNMYGGSGNVGMVKS